MNDIEKLRHNTERIMRRYSIYEPKRKSWWAFGFSAYSIRSKEDIIPPANSDYNSWYEVKKWRPK